MKPDENWLRKQLKTIYLWTKKHWFISSLLSLLQIIWFPFVISYIGYTWFVSQNTQGIKQLTPAGLIITLLILAPIFLIKAANNHYAANEEENKSNEIGAYVKVNKILNQMVSSFQTVCQYKFSRFLNHIKSLNDGQNEGTFNIITQPDKQLACIVSEITDCLQYVSDIPKDKIEITFAYKFDDKDFVWLDESYIHGSFSLEELVTNSKSTFYELIHSPHSQKAYHNNKQKAIDSGHYIPIDRDSDCNNVGSIICRRVSLRGDNKVYMEGILTISTYGEMIEPQDDDEQTLSVVYKNIWLILQKFEDRMLIEMSLLYMKLRGCK